MYLFQETEISILQEINEQKSKFNNNLNIYEGLIDKYFPDEKGTGDAIRIIGVQFISNADKLVKLKTEYGFYRYTYANNGAVTSKY